MFKNPGYDFDNVMNNLIKTTHFYCLKYARIQAFFWSVFSHIQTKYGDSQSKSLYSAQTRENMGEKKSGFGHLSRHVHSLLMPFTTKSNNFKL